MHTIISLVILIIVLYYTIQRTNRLILNQKAVAEGHYEIITDYGDLPPHVYCYYEISKHTITEVIVLKPRLDFVNTPECLKRYDPIILDNWQRSR